MDMPTQQAPKRRLKMYRWTSFAENGESFESGIIVVASQEQLARFMYSKFNDIDVALVKLIEFEL